MAIANLFAVKYIKDDGPYKRLIHDEMSSILHMN